MSHERGREILEQLLRERTPQERERLSQAWEKAAGGDPDSLPVLFALSDRFSLEAHAALLGEMRVIHASFEEMAREIGQGASATVEKTQAAAKAAADHAARFGELIPKLENVVSGQQRAATTAQREMADAAKQISHELKVAKHEAKISENLWMTLVIALFIAIACVAGFLAGGHLYEWRKVEHIRSLASRSVRKDKEATRLLWEEIEDYRQRHEDAPIPEPAR